MIDFIFNLTLLVAAGLVALVTGILLYDLFGEF